MMIEENNINVFRVGKPGGEGLVMIVEYVHADSLKEAKEMTPWAAAVKRLKKGLYAAFWSMSDVKEFFRQRKKILKRESDIKEMTRLGQEIEKEKD